ncbi:putative methyltransferase NSUN6 [Liparis tanakae]|uniref:Putative methyltransferase NSUN6 n=1 Tax=Liparis tanakae TaxID=230148 RepID=A0A4Z2GZ49_9TELE|nr:putative methyltransferase NSUN6 [Liparis tanakae]
MPPYNMEEMSIFPRISLRPEVTEYLRSVFLNKEVLAAIGHQEAECRFHKLLTCLSHPPSYTCVRASTHLAPLEEIRHKLGEELHKMCCSSPSMARDMKAGDAVSVLSDLEGRCTRGATSFQGNRVFVGNGVAQIDRSSIFCSAERAK